VPPLRRNRELPNRRVVKRTTGALNGDTVRNIKPSRMIMVWTTTADPTRAKARLFESARGTFPARCSVNFQAMA